MLPLDTDFNASGEAKRLTVENRLATNAVFTNDGNRILYRVTSGLPAVSELRSIAVSGASSSEPVPFQDDRIAEFSLQGGRLVYSQFTRDPNVWRVEIDPAGSSLSSPRLLIASTHMEYQPRYSPDGGKIAFTSTRSGNRELWVSEADGSSPVQLTSFGGPLVGGQGWSPDSQRLMFHARTEGQADIFVIAAHGGLPKRLAKHPSDDLDPSYSHDGRSIYFMSNRSGRYETWKMPADGGEAIQITKAGVRRFMESPDGKALFYVPLQEREIWKVPVEGGEPVKVTGPLSRPNSFAVVTEGIWYAGLDPQNRPVMRFFDFSTRQSRSLSVSDIWSGQQFSLSHDHHSIIFSRIDQVSSDLMVVENFAVQ